MKKLITLSLLASSSLLALSSEHAYLYKDPRVMGMGGANVAVGSYSTSVFSNPAGLANIKKEHGYVVDLLGIGISVSEKAGEFMQDIQDASDIADDDESTKAMTNVLDSYSGEHFHVGVDNYTSISKNSDAFAWSIGLLAAADVNFVAHGGGTTTGGLLETSSRGYGGVILGVAKPYDTEIGRVDIGFGMKYITQNSYEGTLGISELTDDSTDVGKKLQDKYEKTASGYGIDIGVAYKPLPDSTWKPTFGLSILNIGNMSMDENYGKQPLTVNVGVSVTPEVSFLNKLVLAADYVDIFNANTTRIYDYSNTNEVAFTDYAESDMMKRIRLGAGIGLVDTAWFSSTLNVGMYQSAYTAGVNLEMLLLKLNVATYEEQVGVGSVSIPDRRYMAQIGIGW